MDFRRVARQDGARLEAQPAHRRDSRDERHWLARPRAHWPQRHLDLAPLGKTFDGETIEKNGGTGTVFHSKKFTGCVNATLLRKRPLTSWPKHIIDNAISICAGPAAELRISKEEGFRLRLLDSSQAIITQSNG